MQTLIRIFVLALLAILSQANIANANNTDEMQRIQFPW